MYLYLHIDMNVIASIVLLQWGRSVHSVDSLPMELAKKTCMDLSGRQYFVRVL